ncbi:radical SAM protein [Dissulfurirhabdus thermomarina]|uniref:radical SAM protein n=1 Tax=Dissulfurirhabdus thermomarina TaxID=1765737 RepID=UPI0015E8DA83
MHAAAPSRRPGYLRLIETGEFDRRVRALEARSDPCRLCPRACGARRGRGETGFCRTGRLAPVAAWCRHRGEEPCLSGRGGSGTVFFARCTLACAYCQNHRISQEWPAGRGEMDAPALAEVYLELERQGAHNLNWVSATHVLPVAVAALGIAARRGLRLPVVLNSGGYEAVATLRLLEGIVDVYLPDFKYWDPATARRLSGARDYPAAARAAVGEMWRQAGPLEVDADGLAARGLLVRHLVLPGDLSGTAEVLGWIGRELGPAAAVSLMAQYFPAHRAAARPPLHRPLRPGEYRRALAALEAVGLTEGYVQELEARDHYRPDFDRAGHPFEGPDA